MAPIKKKKKAIVQNAEQTIHDILYHTVYVLQ